MRHPLVPVFFRLQVERITLADDPSIDRKIGLPSLREVRTTVALDSAKTVECKLKYN